MTVDLKGALLAAAEEAGKMQEEFEQTRDNLINHINYVEGENNRLTKKLKGVADVLQAVISILSED